MQSSEGRLEGRFPGRSKQIATLMNLMGKPSDPVVPSVFIYGHPSSGKTSVVQAVFESALDRTSWAYINCIECHTPRMLFERAFNQWCDWIPCWNNGFTSVCKIDHINQFVRQIQDGISVNGETRSFGVDQTQYLILDRAERLRDLSATLLPVLLRLSEVSRRNICVILLSTVVIEKFRTKNGAYEPLLIRFPDYSKEDTLQILQLDFAASGRSISVRRTSDDNDEEEPAEESVELDDAFYTSFAEIIYSIFNHNCKDLNELRYLAALLFPLYLKPLQNGRVQKHETSKLYKFAHPYFAEATDKLFLRDISSAEWDKETQQLDSDSADDQKKTGAFLTRTQLRGRADFELPYYTKFLLLASYLASYNPPKFDVRYFAKSSEERSRKKGGGTRKPKADQGGGKIRQQLLGPKSFQVERMLAIFYSIIDDTLEDTIDIQLQITSLTTLRLLVRASNMDRLDAARYKCNVSLEFIRSVAKSVRFEIERYLYDFA